MKRREFITLFGARAFFRCSNLIYRKTYKAAAV
jgi:hypothetical protein